MNKLYAALNEARKQFGRANKDGYNPHLKNKFASLGSMLDATYEALDSHGLTINQKPMFNEAGALVLRTTITHLESGESDFGDVPLLSDTKDGKVNPMQALGSAITYARRFGYEAITGLLREDDDGEGAYPRHREQARPQPPRPPGIHDAYPAPPARPQPRPATAPRPIADFNSWLDGAVKALGLEGEAGLWQTVNRLFGRLVDAGGAQPTKENSAKVARLKAHYGTDGGRQWLRDECRAYAAELKQRATVPPDEADPDEDELGSRE